MKIHRLSFTVLSALATMAAVVLWWGSTPAGAAFTATSSSVLVAVGGTATGVSAAAATTTLAAATLAAPEAVAFSGQATVTSKVVTDPDFGGQTNVVLTIDLSKVTGVGQSTGAKYGFEGQPVIQIRPFVASDLVNGTVAFARIGAAGTGGSRVASMSCALTFNTTTKALAKATVSLVSQ